MNENHANLCPTPQWAERMHTEVLPWVTDQVDLGEQMLEVGPGPGATTEWLRHRVKRLFAVEFEKPAADRLAQKLADTNVEVINGDATALRFDDDSFDAAGSFTMLHHVPTVALQNKLLAEALRVLRPGGVLVGSDSLASDGLHHFHHDDVYNPIEPGTFYTRLQTVGFTEITISVRAILKFVAYKPVLAT
jgi:ubiquinone/menaquinone biosynthesis C-methylase UbiE